MIPSFLTTITRHAQSTQNNKFAISLQCLKKEGRDEVDFLHADKQQIFQKVYILTIQVMPKVRVCKFFAISQEWSGVLMKLYHGNTLYVNQRLLKIIIFI